MGQGSGPAHRLTGAERLELQRRVRAGETHEGAATALGCSAKSVQSASASFTNARLAHTIRGVCARCCDDRVGPPLDLWTVGLNTLFIHSLVKGDFGYCTGWICCMLHDARNPLGRR